MNSTLRLAASLAALALTVGIGAAALIGGYDAVVAVLAVVAAVVIIACGVGGAFLVGHKAFRIVHWVFAPIVAPLARLVRRARTALAERRARTAMGADADAVEFENPFEDAAAAE